MHFQAEGCCETLTCTCINITYRFAPSEDFIAQCLDPRIIDPCSAQNNLHKMDNHAHSTSADFKMGTAF